MKMLSRTTRRRSASRRSGGSLAAACLAAALAAPTQASARTSGAGVLYDALIERPIGLAETLVGLGITGVAYPLALASGKGDVVVDRCVTTPARHTFDRALGDFTKNARSLCSPVGFGWELVGFSFGAVKRPLAYLFGRSPLGDGPDASEEELEI